MKVISSILLSFIISSMALGQVQTTLVFTNPEDSTETVEFHIGDYVELHYFNKKKKHIKSLECRISSIKNGVLKVKGIQNTFSADKIPAVMIVGFQELDQAEAHRREEIKKATTIAAIAGGVVADDFKEAALIGGGIGVANGIAKAATKVEKGEEHWHWLVKVE